MLDMLLLAAKIALPSNDHSTDYRRFWLGCVGVRSDGPMIFSKNGAAMFSTPVKRYQLIPTSHAECRTIQKMDSGGTIYVARVKFLSSLYLEKNNFLSRAHQFISSTYGREE
jgi:hypothetical protein